ncbi:hypothetical protein D3C75_1182910 [compost metagenome]
MISTGASLSGLLRVASDIRVRMPPSPALSARITKERYLTETTRISSQKMSERKPRMEAGSTPNLNWPDRHSRRV